ncbi:MAG: hypothetical protein JZU65_22345 [Chlorobium sp.]|nr:hypothetical protein [Chlorobium sp.]
MDLEQKQLLEYEEKALSYRIYLERGGNVIDLLEIVMPIIASGKPVPKNIRNNFIDYLEKRLIEEIKDNPTDRTALRASRLQNIKDATQVKACKALGISKAKTMRRLLKKHQNNTEPGLSGEALKKRIEREDKK